MHVVIMANGTIEEAATSRAIAELADRLICADGGTRHARAWGLKPQVVIGDMDSLDAGALTELSVAGARVIRHPAQKDETDLELALDLAAREGATQITILGALGGRLDQSIANILLLTWPRLRSIPVSIVEGRDRLLLAQERTTLRGKAGDQVSLLPLSAEVTGVTTDGLEYPLRGETLYMGQTRGVSNVLLRDEATITLKQGLLLVCHRDRQGDEH